MRTRLLVPVLVGSLLLAACTVDDGGRAAPPSGSAADPAVQSEPPGPDDGDAPGPGGGFEVIPEVVRAVEPSVVGVLTDFGQGSGVIYSADGLIVTNNHVVERASSVRVALADGTRLDAEIVAADPLSDLALLRVPRQDLPAATLADELPVVGELAIAIGNPLGLEGTVTAGIVSGLNRAVPAGPRTPLSLTDLIQTDAAISPGNSGGALVDAEGRIIGINVAYLPPGQGAVSIGFAIPAPTVTDVVTQLLEDGTVDHPFLGIQPGTVTPQIAQRFGLDTNAGVLVLAVVPGSPAARAGLEPGDVLVELDGEPLNEVGDLLTLLRQRAPGQTVTLTVLSQGERQEVEATLVPRTT